MSDLNNLANNHQNNLFCSRCNLIEEELVNSMQSKI
jgi:hypothetical protein